MSDNPVRPETHQHKDGCGFVKGKPETLDRSCARCRWLFGAMHALKGGPFR